MTQPSITDTCLAFVQQIVRASGLARRLGFKFHWRGSTIEGQFMTFTMPPSTTVTVIGSPVLADGTTPSKATLSNTSYASSDGAVFTVAADPSVPNGAIITAVANPPAGTSVSATLTETALATEPDGTTTETITGSATIVIAAPPLPPPPAAALVFTFGTPK